MSTENKLILKYFTLSIVLISLIGFIIYQETAITEEQIIPEEEIQHQKQDLGVMNNNSYTSQFELEGVEFQVTYSTDYSEWMITEPKAITTEIKVPNLPTDTTVKIAHINIASSIMSDRYTLNGVTIDSIDRDFLEGIQLTKDHPYTIKNNIQGYSQFTIKDGYETLFSDYGISLKKEYRVTEKDLTTQGAYGQKFTYIFEILVKKPNDIWQILTWCDQFYVPIK